METLIFFHFNSLAYFEILCDICNIFNSNFLNWQVRVWSTHDKIEQTNYAMSIIEPIYDFFTDYFNVTDVMPKTGKINFFKLLFLLSLFTKLFFQSMPRIIYKSENKEGFHRLPQITES